jgi:ABC-2 type transport system permease protein
VLVLIGVSTLCVGLLPRVAAVAWLGVAVVVVIGLFAELFRLPGWARGISPLHHLAPMPAAGFDAVSFSAVSAVALALVAVGTAAFVRRDVPVL